MITVRYMDKVQEITLEAEKANEGMEVAAIREQVEAELGVPADAAVYVSGAIDLDARLIVDGQELCEDEDDTVSDGQIVEFVNGYLEIECGANSVTAKNTAGKTVRELCDTFQDELNIPKDGAAHIDDSMVAYDRVIEDGDEQLAFGRPAGDKGR